MIHFYCLAVEAGFYSDVVECRTLNPADRVQSPVWENVIWIFLLSYYTFIYFCALFGRILAGNVSLKTRG